MTEVFYRKWRPTTLGEVVGQEPVTRTLLNALTTGRVAHAYLFFGPRGTGKTSTGRILAKAVNCLENDTGEPCNRCAMCRAFNEGRAVDLIEIDAASNTGVDDIRNLKEKVNFAPAMAKYKVYIIDEVHMLSASAFNALLKTLEEPPAHVIFVLATTEVHKVPATITSRCQRFDLRRIPLSAMLQRLEHICAEEGITAEREALELIAKNATGSLRDAQNLLEQMVVYHGPNIELHQVRAELGLSGDARVRELVRSIIEGDIQGGLTTINEVANDGLDLKQFGREVTEILRVMLLVSAGAEAAAGLSAEETAEMKRLIGGASPENISRAIKLFSQADFRHAPQSALPLELALVDSVLEGSRQDRYPEPEARPSPAPQKGATAPSAQPEKPAKTTEAQPTRPTTPGPSESKDAAGIEHIQRHWNEFIKACKGSFGQLDALLRGSCKPLSIEGSCLILGFYAKSNFQKSKIENPKYSETLSQKLADVFGTRYEVRCVTIGEENRPAPPPLNQTRLVKEALARGAEIIGEEYVR